MNLEIAAAALRHEVADRARAGDSAPGFRLLARSIGEVNRAFVELERRARRSACTMQPLSNFDPTQLGWELDERSRSRGIALCEVVSPRAISINPLLPAAQPGLRLAPVYVTFTLVDRSLAVVGGPLQETGDISAYIIDDRHLVRMVIDLWDVTWATATPAPVERNGIILTARQVQVARWVCLGMKDASIARTLGVSVRSIERDLAGIGDYLGASGRADIVSLVMGRGRSQTTAEVRRTEA